eukprot:m51a1_g5839 putative kinase family protein (1049) ;mRNA; r:301934-305466
MPRSPISLAIFSLLCLSAAAAGAACGEPEPVATPEWPEVVVGLTSSSASTSGLSSRAGITAALAAASAVSRLRFTPRWLDDAGDPVRSADNARRLLCSGNRSGNAFLMAATVGSASSIGVLRVARELAGPRGTMAPLVGALTSAPELRDAALTTGADGRDAVIFMDRMDLGSGELIQEPSTSYRFAGCTTPSWNESLWLLVGFSLADGGERGVVDGMVRLGLTSALMAGNSGAGTSNMVIDANFRGSSTADNVRRMMASPALAVVGLSGGSAREAVLEMQREHKFIPMFGPLSGSSYLRFPFRREVINLVPLALQEMDVAVQYILSVSASPVRVIAVVYEDTDADREFRDAVERAAERVNANRSNGPSVDVYTSSFGDIVNESIVAPMLAADAFVFAGQSMAAAQFLATLHEADAGSWNKTKVLCSEVHLDLLQKALGVIEAPAGSLRGVHVMHSTPPLLMLPKGNAMRQQYEEWVSSVDRGESSFRGFFLGLVVSAVIRSATGTALDEGAAPETLEVTPQSLVDAVYRKKMFSIDRLTVGPFVDQCERGTGTRCCNQGLDGVYVTAWRDGTFSYVPFVPPLPLQRCGADFDPTDYSAPGSGDRELGLIVGLAVGLGVAALLVVAMMAVVYVRSRRVLSFLNIMRPDLEINECVGKGRFGALHVGDWHGTTVAIRVIVKKEVARGDLAAIKEEIGLLHKLHHPNLLMLMGYCETPSELYVVCEYMSGGSLREYLAKNRGQLSVYSLVAMAFDVVKGIAYLHACRPAIVHGCISTRSLLVDDKLCTKVSDFWYSSVALAARTKYSSASSPSSSASHVAALRKQLEWVAPELASGLVSPATDVWAFGVVLWELFQCNAKQAALQAAAGDTLSSSDDPTASRSSSSSVPMSHVAAQHPDPDTGSAPKEVVELLERCWEPQPDQRPTIFQVLRLWPSTFASVGQFDLPSDLSQAQATDDTRTSGSAPDAVLPVLMMSHSEEQATRSLHFEFRAPQPELPSPLDASGLETPSMASPCSAAVTPGLQAQCLGSLLQPAEGTDTLNRLEPTVSKD